MWSFGLCKTAQKAIAVEAETVTNGGKQLRGRLQLIDNQVNTRSGTVRVRAVFDNRDGSLIPGQFVKMRMGRAKAEPAMLVTERAIGTDQSKRFVIVVGPTTRRSGARSRSAAPRTASASSPRASRRASASS